MMTYLILGICVSRPFLLGEIREFESCLEVYYLGLDC